MANAVGNGAPLRVPVPAVDKAAEESTTKRLPAEGAAEPHPVAAPWLSSTVSPSPVLEVSRLLPLWMVAVNAAVHTLRIIRRI